MTTDTRFALIDKHGVKRYPYKKSQRSTGRFGYALTPDGVQDRHGGGEYPDDIETVVTRMVHDGWSVRAKPLNGTGNTVGIRKGNDPVIVGYEISKDLLHLVAGAEIKPTKIIDSPSQPFITNESQIAQTTNNQEFPSDEFVLKQVKSRRGQANFRSALLIAYAEKCFVTHSSVTSILEAAHITPHSSTTDYSVNNGILLRADIHTLYDLNLIGIDRNGTIHAHPSLVESEYYQFNGKTTQLDLPEKLTENLDRRFEEFFIKKQAP